MIIIVNPHCIIKEQEFYDYIIDICAVGIPLDRNCEFIAYHFVSNIPTVLNLENHKTHT